MNKVKSNYNKLKTIETIVKKIEQLSNKKVMFKEHAKYNRNSLLDNAKRVDKLIEKIESISGKKVSFKEDVDRRSPFIVREVENKTENAYKYINKGVEILISALPHLSQIDSDKDEYEELKDIISDLKSIGKYRLKRLCDKISEKSEALQEDVEMTADDAINKPNLVKSLYNSGIDVDINDDLKNKNSSTNNSSKSTSSSIISA